jgi:hypothetical protein
MYASSGPAFVGTPFTTAWNPIIGYESVFTYRSGARAKSLIEDSYGTIFDHGGTLWDALRKRKKYLEDLVRDTISPSTAGGPTVFSQIDTGHPFASYKISTHDPYGHVYVKRLGSWNQKAYEFDCTLTAAQTLPYPVYSDPLGIGVYNAPPVVSLSYFGWNSNLLVGGTPSSLPRVVSAGTKNVLAAGLIASTNPWSPKASLAVTVLELLRGDVPSVVKNLARYLSDLQSLKKTVGSDWLNVQFGWVPLINDIRAAVGVLFQLHLLLYQSNERRRGRSGSLGSWSRFSTDTGVVSLQAQTASPLFPQASKTDQRAYQNVQWTGQRFEGGEALRIQTNGCSRAVTVSADWRFTARFHRGARPNDTERGYIDRATQLLGLEFTPDMLWQLTPWTWLLDWASNIGAVAQNLSTLDWSNVLLDYAYLTFCVRTETSVGMELLPSWVVGSGNNSYEITPSLPYFSQKFSSVEKVREQASPFGFSVSWDALSAYQLSILAALGITRGR